MPTKGKFKTVMQAISMAFRRPRRSIRAMAGMPERLRASDYADRWPVVSAGAGDSQGDLTNPLRAYFDGNTEGPGIWKWLHYFDIYHRHLQKFVNRDVVVVEVGVFSGGSMPMWRKYFGPASHIHGIDIEEACRAYAGDHITIHIGDQADRTFWKRFREAVPRIDVLIDDGGHEPEQQMVTLEEMLPHIQPGGVFICEDIHGHSNYFAAFAQSLADHLNAFTVSEDKEGYKGKATPLQCAIDSIHMHPFLTVIEKRQNPLIDMLCLKHGTQWQPFYERSAAGGTD